MPAMPSRGVDRYNRQRFYIGKAFLLLQEEHAPAVDDGIARDIHERRLLRPVPIRPECVALSSVYPVGILSFLPFFSPESASIEGESVGTGVVVEEESTRAMPMAPAMAEPKNPDCHPATATIEAYEEKKRRTRRDCGLLGRSHSRCRAL